MFEFFRGWKRKLGGVTLLMACMLLGLWLKTLHSYFHYVEIRLHSLGCGVTLGSGDGWFNVGFSTGRHPPGLIESHSFRIQQQEEAENSEELNSAETTEETSEETPEETGVVTSEADSLSDADDPLRPISYSLFGFTFLRTGRFGGGSGDGLKAINYFGRELEVRYIIVVAPLTVLSAGLLLSKPRAGKATESNQIP